MLRLLKNVALKRLLHNFSSTRQVHKKVNLSLSQNQKNQSVYIQCILNLHCLYIYVCILIFNQRSRPCACNVKWRGHSRGISWPSSEFVLFCVGSKSFKGFLGFLVVLESWFWCQIGLLILSRTFWRCMCSSGCVFPYWMHFIFCDCVLLCVLHFVYCHWLLVDCVCTACRTTLRDERS